MTQQKENGKSTVSSSGALSTGPSWSCGSGARGGPSNDARAGIPVLGGKAGRAGAVQPGEEKAVGRPYCGLPVLERVLLRKMGTDFFSRACSNSTRGNGFKLREGRFRLDIRKIFFTVRVVKHWNRLPAEVVNAPSLRTFQVGLDGALSNLVQLTMSQGPR